MAAGADCVAVAFAAASACLAELVFIRAVEAGLAALGADAAAAVLAKEALAAEISCLALAAGFRAAGADCIAVALAAASAGNAELGIIRTFKTV